MPYPAVITVLTGVWVSPAARGQGALQLLLRLSEHAFQLHDADFSPLNQSSGDGLRLHEIDHVEPCEPHAVGGACGDHGELMDGVLVFVGAFCIDAVQWDDDVVAVNARGGGGGVEHGDVGEGAYDDEVLGARGTQNLLELAGGELVEGVGI